VPIFGSGVRSSFIISSNFSLAKTGCFLDELRLCQILEAGLGHLLVIVKAILSKNRVISERTQKNDLAFVFPTSGSGLYLYGFFTCDADGSDVFVQML
jgi:hypothetical protein